MAHLTNKDNLKKRVLARWSVEWDRCQRCERVKFRHHSHGLCLSCISYVHGLIFRSRMKAIERAANAGQPIPPKVVYDIADWREIIAALRQPVKKRRLKPKGCKKGGRFYGQELNPPPPPPKPKEGPPPKGPGRRTLLR